MQITSIDVFSFIQKYHPFTGGIPIPRSEFGFVHNNSLYKISVVRYYMCCHTGIADASESLTSVCASALALAYRRSIHRRRHGRDSIHLRCRLRLVCKAGKLGTERIGSSNVLLSFVCDRACRIQLLNFWSQVMLCITSAGSS